MATTDIKQKITLDNKEYIKGTQEANSALKAAMTDSNNALTENSKTFAQNESQVKGWSSKIQDEYGKIKQSFMKNLGTGIQALTLDAGMHAVHKAAGDAVNMIVDADAKFAEFKSRISATDEQLKKWKDGVNSTAIATKTSVAAMTEAFMDLSDSADPEQIQKFLGSIGNATLLAHGNDKDVTDFVKKSLTEQGLDFNQQNVEGTLSAADVLRRKGRGFGSMESSMSALGGLDQNSIAASGIGEKGVAALLAGASRNMSTGQASAGVGALLDLNKNGVMQGSQLAGILGVSGKGGLSTNGALDISKIANSGTYSRLMGLGGGDEKQAMEIFRSISGVGGDASDAMFKMIKNFKEMNATVQSVNADNVKLSDSAGKMGDSLEAMYTQMEDKLVVGFEDIFEPLKGPIKSLLGGHVGDALKGAPGAIGGALGGIADHPMLAASAVLGTAVGGSLLNGVLGKLGMGSVAGIAKGNAMKAAGIEPVFVVNADEIAEKSGGFMGKAAGLLTGAKGGLGALAASAGGLSTIAGGVGIAGAAGYVAGTGINMLGDKMFGQKGIGGAIYDAFHDTPEEKSQKIVVEIHNKADGFDAKPTSKGMTRDSRTQ